MGEQVGNQQVGRSHVLNDSGFAVVNLDSARARRALVTNYVKVVCREARVHEVFFFGSDPKSRARALDAATRLRASLAGAGRTVRLSTWNPCPGMPAQVRAINVPSEEE